MAYRRDRGRISREGLYLRLFEYMFYSDTKQGFTKYELMRIPNLPSQRQDRVSEVIEFMIDEGHLQIVFDAPTATYYNITEKGKTWYKEYGKEFLRVISSLRKKS